MFSLKSEVCVEYAQTIMKADTKAETKHNLSNWESFRVDANVKLNNAVIAQVVAITVSKGQNTRYL